MGSAGELSEGDMNPASEFVSCMIWRLNFSVTRFLSCEVIIRVVPTLLGCGDPMTEYIGNVLYLSFTLCVFYVFSHPGAAKKLFQCCQS